LSTISADDNLGDEMKTILVTGGAGFIGSNFVRHWSKTYPEDQLVVLDSLTYAGNAESLVGIPKVDLVVETILNTELVERILRERDVGLIVHFAAESHVDRSIEGPDAFIEANVLGTHSLLKAARRVWLSGSAREHRFHHVSTDEVYGSLGLSDPAFSEISQYSPNSPYSASKAASDHLVRAYHHTYGLQVTTTNCSNNYGPYQFPEKLIPLFLLNALHGKPLPIYGDGKNVRDWLHVSDHCDAIERVIKGGQPGEVYNVGGGVELENIFVVDAICRIVDKVFDSNRDLAARYPNAPPSSGRLSGSLKKFVNDRPGHDRRYAIDERKIRLELSYEPKIKFEAGLLDTLNWYLSNEQWWRAILDGSYRK
jgi:dTDP-glucose 4,6-dehydratase